MGCVGGRGRAGWGVGGSDRLVTMLLHVHRSEVAY